MTISAARQPQRAADRHRRRVGRRAGERFRNRRGRAGAERDRGRHDDIGRARGRARDRRRACRDAHAGARLGRAPRVSTIARGLHRPRRTRCRRRLHGRAPLPARRDRRDDRAVRARDLAIGIRPPVQRPDPVHAPAELAEQLRAQPIAIARARRGRVGIAVVLDREDEPIGIVGIGDREIDRVRTAADAMAQRPSALGERVGDRRGHRARRRALDIRRRPPGAAPGAREREQRAKIANVRRGRVGLVRELVRGDARHDHELLARASSRPRGGPALPLWRARARPA